MDKHNFDNLDSTMSVSCLEGPCDLPDEVCDGEHAHKLLLAGVPERAGPHPGVHHREEGLHSAAAASDVQVSTCFRMSWVSRMTSLAEVGMRS